MATMKEGSSGIRTLTPSPELEAQWKKKAEERRARTDAKIADDLNQLEEIYNQNRNREINPLPIGSWFRQRNAMGMWTCQFVSAINALQFLGVYDSNIHTEERFIEVVGGQDFARENPRGVDGEPVARALRVLAPNVRVRTTDSIAEIVRSAINGAAVTLPYRNHEVVTPPGYNLRRTGREFEVQVANSLTDQPEFYPLDTLIHNDFHFNIATQPTQPIGINSILIIERKGPPPIRTIRRSNIRTLPTEGSRIVTVNRARRDAAPITTIRTVRRNESLEHKISRGIRSVQRKFFK